MPAAVIAAPGARYTCRRCRRCCCPPTRQRQGAKLLLPRRGSAQKPRWNTHPSAAIDTNMYVLAWRGVLGVLRWYFVLQRTETRHTQRCRCCTAARLPVRQRGCNNQPASYNAKAQTHHCQNNRGVDSACWRTARCGGCVFIRGRSGGSERWATRAAATHQSHHAPRRSERGGRGDRGDRAAGNCAVGLVLLHRLVESRTASL